MVVSWVDSTWHIGEHPYTVHMPWMPVRVNHSWPSNKGHSPSFPFVDSFCQPEFNGTWASITNELGAFTPCFIDIIILGSAHVALVAFAASRLYILQSTPAYLRLVSRARGVYVALSLLAAFCAVVPLMQLSARVSLDSVSGNVPLPPFETLSLVLSALAWVTAGLALFREVRSTSPQGWWYVRFGVVFVLVGQLAKLRFLLMLEDRWYSSFFDMLFLTYTGAHVVFGLFALFFFPTTVPGPAYDSMPADHYERHPAGGSMYEQLPDGPTGEQTSPEFRAGFFSWLTFSWITPLLAVGRKRPLEDSDVWQLDPSDTAAIVHERFKSCWEDEKAKQNPWLLRALFTCFGPRFLRGGLFKIGNDASQFVGPVMLSSLLSAMQSAEPAWHGYVYATAILLGLVFGVLCEARYFQNVMRVGFQIRQALVAAVFAKSLRLSHNGRQGFSSGRIVNMMTSDTETLQIICQQLHNLWSAPLRILICMFLLYKQLGIASLAGFGMLVLIIPLQAFIVNNQQKLVKQALQKGDKRIELINEILSSMDVVKCYAWEESFKQKVLKVREEELSRIRRAQYIMALNFFLLNVIPVLVTVVGFGVYALLAGNLTPAKAFTSISLFGVLRMPLYTFPQLITQVVQSNVSLKRIQEMLLADERSLAEYPPLEPGQPAVEVNHGSFTWGGKADKVTLQDISLRVAPGSLVAIVGGTGQGKSSLISAMLGEMPPVEGSPAPVVHGSVAYVAQVAWIFNATVCDNILFGLPYDRQRYDRAVRVSALERDFELLPGGDLTEIGERGVNVSGGQKQRISIARAVYADADVFFFDDPLSALDAHVAKQVFETCVRDGLHGKTRIMATNQLHFLPRVDHVVLVHDGKIAEQGTYEELMAHGELFQELMEQAGSMEDSAEETKGETDGAAAGNGKAEGSKPPAFKHDPDAGTPTIAEKDAQKMAKAGTTLIKTEERETGVVSLAVIGRYVGAMGGSPALLVLLGLYVLIEVARVGSSAWVSLWSGAATAPGGAPHPVSYYISGYTIICLLQVLLTFCNQFWLVLSSLRAAKRLHEAMLGSILRAPMAFFHTNPLGRLINRFTKDTADIDKSLAQYTSLCLGAIFQLLSTFSLIGYLNTIALWAIVPLLFVFYFVYLYFQSTAREVKRLDAITRSPVYAQFGEALNGLATIRSYRAQDRMAAMNGSAMDRNTRYALVNMSANRWLGIRLEFLGGLMIFATAVFAILDVQRAENPAELASTMGLILSYALSITMIMTMVLRLASMAENSFNAVERVGTYADLEPEAPPVIEDSRPPPDWPSEGQITFDKVVMRYREDLPPVLKGLTAVVKGGEKVGVVGRTGAGKSSLFNALFRITEIESGQISIDGYDLAKFGLLDVRRALMIIPQTPVLFTGSIRFNLDPFGERSDTEVWEALGRAHLREVVARMPLGLETEVVEGGDNFSVGQRQLLSLARALLRHAKILVLDEATAAVDVGTDALIQKTIREEFKDCTMLIIAHRLNTIIDSDRILVMDAGLGVEYDTPARLLANEGSVFCGMVRSTGAANAKYLMRIARGEVDVKEELAAPAAAEAQKWAQEATTRRWKEAAKWAFAKAFANSQVDLQKACPERQEEQASILEKVRDATSTLQAVLAGQHSAELREALRQAEVEEDTWWSALFRVVQGLALMTRNLQSRMGEDEQPGLPWSHPLALSNAEHQGE